MCDSRMDYKMTWRTDGKIERRQTGSSLMDYQRMLFLILHAGRTRYNTGRTSYCSIILLWFIFNGFISLGSAVKCPTQIFTKPVPENTPINTELFSIKIEPDTTWTFQPHPSQASFIQGYLGLDVATGNITLLKPLDAEMKNPSTGAFLSKILYNLVCSYSENGEDRSIKYDVAIFISNVNDNIPKFINAPFFKEVNELTPVSTTIFMLRNRAYDEDLNGAISYYEILGGSDGKFKLTGATSEGKVAVSAELDYDRGKRLYVLNVSATDNGKNDNDPSYSNTTTLTIKITDGDDQDPIFEKQQYYIEIQEQITPNNNNSLDFNNSDSSVIGKTFFSSPRISAYDQDLGINQSVNYSITKGNFVGSVLYFEMNPTNGGLIPRQLLDREDHPVWKLIIKACQTDKPEKCALADLDVKVKDVNDNRPQMEFGAYSLSIAENPRIGEVIVTVRARDPDAGDNAALAYRMVDPSNAFQLDPVSGIVKVKNPQIIDREKQDVFIIEAYAVETKSTEKYESNKAKISITVEDRNDNTPQFYPSLTYIFNIIENATNGSTVGTVYANDTDLAENAKVKYTITFASNNGTTHFKVDPNTGRVYTSALLSDPYFPEYRLTISATDQPIKMSERRTNSCLVVVYVANLNNHAPEFLGAPYQAKISEAAIKWTVVKQLKATDRDQNSKLKFSILSGDSDDVFNVTESGAVVVQGTLDREKIPEYNLTVQVTDDHYKVTTALEVTIVDSNDNAPKFTQQFYNFSIKEEQAAGLLVGTVQANDKDIGDNAKIIFSISTPWARNLFTINTTSGELTTKTDKLDREKQDAYEFRVEAEDQGSPTRLSSVATVTVTLMDINDNIPQFEKMNYEITIPENTTPMNFMYIGVTDADVDDNQNVSFSISSGNAFLFEVTNINGTMGSISARREISLQHNAPKQYTLIVRATNVRRLEGKVQGQRAETNATVVVKVEDLNDAFPVFTQNVYSTDISEDQATGKSIGKVLAQDTDYDTKHNKVHYWMKAGSDSRLSLDENTGVISLLNKLDYDPPTNDTLIEFEVFASNLVSSPNGTVINSSALVRFNVKDVNDNAPVFSQASYSATLNESQPMTAEINLGISATDIDQGVNREFYFLLQRQNLPFTIDQTSGLLKLKSPLDYESGVKMYKFKVLAQDRGNPILTGSADVTISVVNINDNEPRFKESLYTFQTSEGLPSGTFVGKVQATDEDGDTVKYMLDSSVQGLLDIDNTTGEIKIATPIDREKNQTLEFNVIASDGRFEKAVKVTVRILDQNDNSPRFEQPVYHANLTENEPSRLLFQISATDKDEGQNAAVTYNIISGNEENIFTINKTTGELYLVDGSKLNFNKKPVYYLVLEARDGGTSSRSSYCTAELRVVDTNNKAPVFKQLNYRTNVKENQPVGTTVIQVLATDEDTVGKIEYDLVVPSGAGNGNFTMDKTTGLIKTGIQFDRESKDQYTLNVSACDGVKCGYASVEIGILDTNDHAPVFGETSYTGYIQQNAKVDRSIVMVNASDGDLGTNQELTYWITNTDGKFKVDHDTGIVRVAGTLDKSVKDVYAMLVFAEDHGIPALRSNVSLTVYVNNTNQHVPKFSEFSYEVLIPETSSNGTLVIQVNASDNDDGKAGVVSLELLSGNDNRTFVMHSDGSIYLVKQLDYEKHKYYELKVEAKDQGGDPLSSTAVVRITVADVNDNAPIFAPLPDLLQISAQAVSGTVIYRVNATDKDSSLNNNNKVLFSLTKHADKFSIVGATGVITVKTAPLATGDYSLVIKATDQGSPKLSTEVTLKVKVISSLDNIPVFGQMPFISKVNEAIPVNAVVTDINATLGGKGPNDVGVYFNITEGNEDKYFELNQNNGTLLVAKKLDREAKAYHFLLVTAYNEADPRFTAQAGVIVELVDEKDTPPKFPFTRYDVVVAEDTPVNKTIATIYADDPDQHNSLQYGIAEDDSGGQFSVSTQSNKAVIKVAKQLDRDLMPANQSSIYTLKVTASDGSNKATTLVRILVEDVNDNSPMFPTQQYNKTVPENIGPGYEVLQVKATDLDRVDVGKIRYKIISGNTNNSFNLNNVTGVISRSMTVALDRERKASFLLTVLAMDSANNNASVDVSIAISDMNDNPPVFIGLPYETSINEGPESLSLAYNISVSDKDSGNNSLVTFSIVTGNEDKEFRIDTNNNVGTLRVIKELDREKSGLVIKNGVGVYSLAIQATDSGTPSLSATATVIIHAKDINDKPPKFEKEEYVVPVSEGSPLMFTIVTISASDPDEPANTNLTYSIAATGNPDETFIIDPQTGEVKLNKSLDISVQSIYNLTLEVSDGKQSSQAKMKVIVVDANDNDPVFKSAVYKFSVLENDATNKTGEYVGQVAATDKDEGLNGEITFRITSRNAQGLFSVSQDGNITTAGTLNREVVDKYFIIVTAEDKGKPSRRGTCEVEITILDVNDNPPEFVNAPYTGTVLEHSAAGTAVVVRPPITTSDKDIGDNAQIHYELAGPDAELFAITNASGDVAVRITNSSALDRETRDTYLIQVVAKDKNGAEGYLNVTANLTIILNDINDMPPVFKLTLYEFNISEKASPNTEVGGVSATDKDLGTNAMLQYSIIEGHEGKFYIDRLSGKIYVTGGLDRETVDTYHLNISAQDRGVIPGPLEGFTKVVINIEDFNDNPPQFDRSEISVNVSEEQDPPTFITQVNATDKDIGLNGKITYFLTAKVPFNISEEGNITTTDKLDREKTPEYTFKIFAKDSGTPGLQSQTTIRVKVTDINDHAPVFEHQVYYANILEKSPVKSVILWPKAVDTDEGSNAKLIYSLSGPGSSYFNMNHETGLITIEKYIDKNKLISEGLLGDNVVSNSTQNSTLDLTVTATDDGSPSLTGTAVLYVKIDDISDDTPLFKNASYDVVLEEEVPKDTFVVQVQATTKDKSTILEYELTKANKFFSLDKKSGNVTTTGRRLDREERMYYSFTVVVLTSNRIPQRTSYTVVSITLGDINDHIPTFTDKKYSYTLDEGKYTDQFLGTIQAKDSDYGKNGTITYTIIKGNKGGEFSINNETGVLSVVKPLDREQQETYSLEVQAKDGDDKNSTVPVLITVKDVNDVTPMFYNYPYFATVMENDVSGIEVAKVYANDSDGGLNGQIFYHIRGGDDNKFFMENKGGFGIVKTLTSLDYEAKAGYEITVAAVDLGNPPKSSTAMVYVNVTDRNDNQPKFSQSQYEVSIKDDLPIGSSVITLKAGIGRYFYNISGPDADGSFAINSTNGTILVTKTLNARAKSQYDLDVMATDYHEQPTAAKTKVRIKVADSSPFPIFEPNTYSVVFKENQKPPQMVVDLNTTDEIRGRPVLYSIVKGNDAGIFRIVPDSGKVFCEKELDRETLSTYTLVIRALKNDKTTKRTKRATAPPNEATVKIEVGDVNDHPPKFERNSYLAGVPADATFNSHVMHVKATDEDTSDQKSLVYSILPGKDGDYFYMDSASGEILSKISFGLMQKKEFAFKIMVKDSKGKGFNDTANVEVKVLSDSQQTILVANIAPNKFKDRQKEIIGNLSNILGFEVRMEKIEPHVETSGGDTKVDVSRTDMYFYAVNPIRRTIVRKDKLKARIIEKKEEIDALFSLFNLDGDFKYVPVKKVSYSVSTAEAALMALGIVIVVGCIAGIIVVYYSWRRRKAEKVNNSLLISNTLKQTGSESGVFLANPLYAESTAEEDNVDSLPVDEDGNPVIIVNGAETETTAQSETWYSTTTSVTSIQGGVNSDVPVMKRRRKPRKYSDLSEVQTEIEDMGSSTDTSSAVPIIEIVPSSSLNPVQEVTLMSNDLQPGTEVVPISDVDDLDIEAPPSLKSVKDEPSKVGGFPRSGKYKRKWEGVMGSSGNGSDDFANDDDEDSVNENSSTGSVNGSPSHRNSEPEMKSPYVKNAVPNRVTGNKLLHSPFVNKVLKSPPMKRRASPSPSINGGQNTPGDTNSAVSPRRKKVSISPFSVDSGVSPDLKIPLSAPPIADEPEDSNNNDSHIDSVFQEVFYGSDGCLSEEDMDAITGSTNSSKFSMNDLGGSDDILVKPYIQNGGVVNPGFNNDYNCYEEVTWL